MVLTTTTTILRVNCINMVVFFKHLSESKTIKGYLACEEIE